MDIEHKIASLKCSWVKWLYTENFHKWKIIPLQYINFLVKTSSFILTLTSQKIPYYIFLASTKIYWNFELNIIKLSIATSKNPLVVNTIRINSFCYNVITCARFHLKQMWRLMKAKTEMKREHWTKRPNWSSCTKLALRASWTHGLIAQSIRASEWNSVVVV